MAAPAAMIGTSNFFAVRKRPEDLMVGLMAMFGVGGIVALTLWLA